ncbi:MAG TPA: hypothetical protein VFH63_03930 [candidate division Zixibacteria bacterium]|nr:hypothetical protein [candidate division Zixibacteria bacterium]
MAEPIALIVLVVLLCITAFLYAQLLSVRVHQRRVQGRIDETIHLTAVVRATLAERRSHA